MLAIKLWNYLRGYVIIKVKGLSLERLLNLALAHDIYLWDVKRLSNTEILATISIEGYRSIEDLVRKVGCEVQIVYRKGFPFLLDYFKKRKMLALGILLFIIIISLFSSMIWKIDIVGTEQIPYKEIIGLLEDNNIKEGRFKKSLNMDEIELLILGEYDYISFLDIRTVGVKLIIELKEEDIPPEEVDKSYPANIIAKKKGLIVKIVAKQGKAMVEKGSIVNEGDLLISGVMDSELSEEVYLVHSEGEAMAQTNYSATIELPIIEHEKKETGNIYRQKGLKIGKKGIKLFSGEVPYEDYKEEVEEKSLISFKNLSFPIKVVNYIYKEVELKEVKHDLDFLKKSAQLKAIEEINKEFSEDSEILSREVIHQLKGNILETKVMVDVIEDISKIQIIKN